MYDKKYFFLFKSSVNFNFLSIVFLIYKPVKYGIGISASLPPVLSSILKTKVLLFLILINLNPWSIKSVISISAIFLFSVMFKTKLLYSISFIDVKNVSKYFQTIYSL